MATSSPIPGPPAPPPPAFAPNQYFSLRWNNFQNNLTSVFHELLENQSFVDVTLACEENYLKAHKVVLSACSEYFQKVLLENPCEHPTIILPGDVCFSDLQFIIEFVYRGEIDVSEIELQSLLRTAEQLKIKGLCELTDYREDSSSFVTSSLSHSSSNNHTPIGSKRAKIVPTSLVAQQQFHGNGRSIPSLASVISPLANPGSTYSNNLNCNNTNRVVGTGNNSPMVRGLSNSNTAIANSETTIISGGGDYEGNRAKLLKHKDCERKNDTLVSSDQQPAHHHHQQQTQQQSRRDANKNNMTSSIGMGLGMNGGLLVPMGYLDFAPEPPAPTATPVTEHVDLSCTPTSSDTRDLSNFNHNHHAQPNHHTHHGLDATSHNEIRIKFETLRSLDPQDEMNMENSSPMLTIHHLDNNHHHHQQQQHQQNSQQQQQQPQQPQQQQHLVNGNGKEVPVAISTVATTMAQVQNVITTTSLNGNGSGDEQCVMVTSNGNGTAIRESPIQTSTPQIINQMPAITTTTMVSTSASPTTPTNAMEVDNQQQQLNIKMESDPLNNVIVKQEIVTLMNPNQMEIYNSDASEDSKMMSNGSRSISPNSQYNYTANGTPTNNGTSTPSTNNGTTTTNGNGNGNAANNENRTPGGPKTWTQEDMESALDALRNHNMSLTKASVTYGIPSTTLWQRAHRLGIDTPKKEGPTKSWSEDSLNNALEALRTGTISANKASKAFGIPSSTLYKIARREGIRLAAPFNAAPTTWTQEDLERALESIRAGQSSVQRASTEFGIPTGTLYGRCKREGIELSRSNPTPWSEDAMMEALDAVRVGQMSINQAAIHYNLPYSSLYGRFKRGKYETTGDNNSQAMDSPDNSHQQQTMSSPTIMQQQQQQQQQQQTQQILHQTQQGMLHSNCSTPQHHQQQSPHHQMQQIQIQQHHQSPTHQQTMQQQQPTTMAITIRNAVNPLDMQQQMSAANVQINAGQPIQTHYLHPQPILPPHQPQILHPLHQQFQTYSMERFEIKQEKNP